MKNVLGTHPRRAHRTQNHPDRLVGKAAIHKLMLIYSKLILNEKKRSTFKAFQVLTEYYRMASF